ncbi:MAG: hypothetical protein ABW000_07355 [Actinoplanes sp.]
MSDESIYWPARYQRIMTLLDEHLAVAPHAELADEVLALATAAREIREGIHAGLLLPPGPTPFKVLRDAPEASGGGPSAQGDVGG